MLGALLVASILGIAGLLITTQHATLLADSQLATANLAQALAEQTSRTIQQVDLTLRELQGRLAPAATEAQDSATGPDSKATFDMLVERVKALPQVFTLMLVGANGRIANVSRDFPAPPPLDLSGRDYYQYLRSHDDHALFVSAPAKSYRTGEWIVVLSRRVNAADGGFAGIVAAVVPVGYLEEFYRAVTPTHGAVTVLRRDGMIMLRYPPIENKIGATLRAEAPWYRVVEAGGGSYLSPGHLDGVASLVSVQLLRDFPLVIAVSTTRTAALSGWYRQVLLVLAGALLAAAGVIGLLWAFGRQLSRLAGQNALLEIGRQRFDAVLDNISQGLSFFDADQKLVVSNRRYAEMYRLSPEQTRPGTSLSEILTFRINNGSLPDMTAAEYLARRQGLVEAAQTFDIIDECADGQAVSMHYQSLPSGGWVVTHEDITERGRAAAALAFMARHDALTQLPNRLLFQERLAEAIAMTRRGGHCALLCLDIDRFKVINDTLGHPIGDGLLCAVGARLVSVVRESDTVARLGGDEFAIVLAGLISTEQAAALAQRIVLAFGEHFEVEDHRITVTASIGLSLAPRDGVLADRLLKNADVALYLAKAEGRGTCHFFEPAIDAPIQRRRVVEFDLRNAVPTEDFVLHYQPILDLCSGRVTGFEALVRWQHPVKGMISPAEFIPVAEETGMIVPIGAWVLQKACLEAASWPADIEIAVNLSPVQFKRGQVLDVVRAALAASGLSPHRLELEITESTLLENTNERQAVLHELRALGVKIALDDFGTGYSTLSYLRSFPFDKIKIDQSFVRDINLNRESVLIVDAIVGLARSLGMTTVAEGVETAQQLAVMRRQGVAKVQGYLFSRPRPADDLPELLRTLRVAGANEAKKTLGAALSPPGKAPLEPAFEGEAGPPSSHR